MNFKFTPGPPKPASKVTLNQLKKLVAEGDSITADKHISPEAVKVFLSGPKNAYLDTTRPLLSYLAQYHIDVK